MSRHYYHNRLCVSDVGRASSTKRRKNSHASPRAHGNHDEDVDVVESEIHRHGYSRRAIFGVGPTEQSLITRNDGRRSADAFAGSAVEGEIIDNQLDDFPPVEQDEQLGFDGMEDVLDSGVGREDAMLGSGEVDEEHDEEVEEEVDEEVDEEVEEEEVGEEDGPNSSMLAAYERHIESLNDNGLNLCVFSPEEKVQLDLLQTLGKLGAPMKAYEAVMQWKNRSVRSGYVFREEAIQSRKTVLSRVTKRLNRGELKPVWETLHLPYTDVTVRVAYFNAMAVFSDLLSCKLLNCDANYIFDGDWNEDLDPYAVPNGIIIGDLNTGRSYLKTHRKYCKNPNDMLLACPLAMDKTVCDVGGAGRLSLEPITIQYGLVKFDVRKKHDAMRVLGYVHCMKAKPVQAEGGDSTVRPNAPFPMYDRCSDACWKVNEYHMQVDFILRRSGYLDLQEKGIKWNIQYRGKSYPTVLHPFVPFIIGDTEGHDGLCGHYRSRTANVAQLCRTCECPTMKMGWSKGRSFPKRTPSNINRLVRSRSFDVLQSKSQHLLANAFDNIRFGSHSDRGIFGACPAEILHLMMLGWFKYTVRSFFRQIGEKTIACRKYVRLCLDISSQLGRQSDREIPRITTNDFSSASNIPGHEYAGVLLIMLLAFETSRYGEIFDRSRLLAVHRGQKDKRPGHDNFIADWKLLLSSLLEWWAWMKQPQISRKHAQRSKYATAYLLRLLKSVAPNFDGMKNNTVKTHLVLHMADDIQDFGVPEVFNSAYAESAHIPIAKKTVRNTQKRNATFELQAAQRYAENLAISHANRQVSMEDAENGVRWDDGVGGNRQQWIGKSYSISADALGTPRCSWKSDDKKTGNQAVVPPQLLIGAHLLETVVDHLLPCLDPPIAHCRTEYRCPNGVLYRAHPNYEDKPWYDHILVDWDDVATPARILCIVSLQNAKPNKRLKFPGQDSMRAEPGLYIIVQSYDRIDVVADKARKDAAKELSMHVSQKKRRRKKVPVAGIAAAQAQASVEHAEEIEEDDAPIFEAYRLSLLANSAAHLPMLYIIHVDSIVGPTIVIGDVSRHMGPPDPSTASHPFRAYIFMSRRRKVWADNWTSFIDWQYQKTVKEDVAESSEDEDGD